MKRAIVCVASAFAVLNLTLAHAGDEHPAGRINPVLGEKLDSGLGELSAAPTRPSAPPPAVTAERLNPIPGEKLASGLGELPPHWSPEIAQPGAPQERVVRR